MTSLLSWAFSLGFTHPLRNFALWLCNQCQLKAYPLAQFWVGCTCWRKWICAYWKWNSRTRFECVIRWRTVEFKHDHNRADSHCCYEKQQNYLLCCQGYHYHNTQKLNQPLREKFIWITILIVLLNWRIRDLLDFNDN